MTDGINTWGNLGFSVETATASFIKIAGPKFGYSPGGEIKIKKKNGRPRSVTDVRIMEAIEKFDEGATIADIQKVTGCCLDSVRAILAIMEHNGQIRKEMKTRKTHNRVHGGDKPSKHYFLVHFGD